MARKKKEQSSDYKITLRSGGQVYSAAGVDFVDAINKLDAKILKVKGVLAVDYLGKHAEMFLRPLWARRLSVNKDMKLITQKKFLTLLK